MLFRSLNEEQREYLTLVKTSGEALLTVINDILDFSKIEAGRLDINPIDFELRDSLGNTLKTLSLRAHEKGLELALHVTPNVPYRLHGDPTRLRQIIVNLVGNAIKFTQGGTICLTQRHDIRWGRPLSTQKWRPVIVEICKIRRYVDRPSLDPLQPGMAK